VRVYGVCLRDVMVCQSVSLGWLSCKRQGWSDVSYSQASVPPIRQITGWLAGGLSLPVSCDLTCLTDQPHPSG
jgi:hypothetical protein